MDHQAGEEAPAGHVLAGFVSQILRQGVRDVDALIVHTRSPKRQPAKPGLEDAVANIRVSIHDTGAEKCRHRSHRTPRVRGSPANERVVPEIAVARITLGKTVMRDTEPCFVRRGPDRLQIRVIDGNAFIQVRIDPRGPWRARPGFDFFHRYVNRFIAHHDERFEPMWILTAKVVRKAVIRANESNLNLNIVRSRRRSRKHELNIYSFFIHISNARFEIVIGAAWCRKAATHKFWVMPPNLFPRTRFA